jgi:NDP-sugar pyrophosphorylase family protein
MKAVILAAGKGKRLRPISSWIAKAMVPYGGKPIIQELILRLEALNPEEVIVVVGWLGDQIEEFLGSLTQGGTRIRYVRQSRPEGTAHALLQAVGFVEGDFLVAACDSLFSEEHLKELWRCHVSERCDATLSLKIMERREITSSSSVLLNEDGSVSRVIEKPSEEEVLSRYASSPLYVFGEAIKEYLPGVKRSVRGEYEIQDAVQAMIDDGRRVMGVLSRKWTHLSDIEDFLRMNFDYLERWLPRRG